MLAPRRLCRSKSLIGTPIHIHTIPSQAIPLLENKYNSRQDENDVHDQDLSNSRLMSRIQNTLPPNKIIHWLSQKGYIRSTLRSNRNNQSIYTLDAEIETHIYTLLAQGKYGFGTVPIEFILPYLSFSPSATREIQEDKTSFISGVPGFDNLYYLCHLAQSTYINNSNIAIHTKAFFNDQTMNVDYKIKTPTFSIKKLKTLPVLKVKIEDQGTTILVLKVPLYVMSGAIVISCAKWVYGFSPRMYLDFYRGMTPQLRANLAYILYQEGLADKLRYNPDSHTHSILDVLNFPDLIRKHYITVTNDQDFTPEKMRCFLHKVKLPLVPVGCARLGLGAEARLVRLLNKNGRLIPPAVLVMLARTDLSINHLRAYLEREDLWEGDTMSMRFLYKLSPKWATHSINLYLSPEEVMDEPIWSRTDLHEYLAYHGVYVPEINDLNVLYMYTYITCTILDHCCPFPTDKHKLEFNPKILNALSVRYNWFVAHSFGTDYTEDADLFISLAKFLNIKEEVLHFPALITILARGFVYPLPMSENEIDRARLWRSLSDTHKNLLRILYDDPRLFEYKFSILPTRLLGCESLICQFKEHYSREQMLDLGMIVPYSMTPLEYFSVSLLYLRTISEREENFSFKIAIQEIPFMCDTELVDFIIGGYTGARSRQELCLHAERVIHKQDVVALVKAPYTEVDLPLGRKELFPYCSYAPSTNPFNLLFVYKGDNSVYEFTLTELDILNKDLFIPNEDNTTNLKITQLNIPTGMSAQGIPTCHSLNREGLDLLMLLLDYCLIYVTELAKTYIDKGVFTCMNTELELKGEPMEGCLEDVALTNIQSLKSIRKRAELALIRCSARDDYELKLVNTFLGLSELYKKMIVDGLVMFFECGMIQRQWDGVKGKYPHTEAEAKSEREFKDKDIRVGQMLANICEHLTKMDANTTASSLLQNLPLMTLDNDRQTESFFTEENKNHTGIRTLKHMYTDIVIGEAQGGICIRTASGKLISTAYYWLKMFNRLAILGAFDILRLGYFG